MVHYIYGKTNSGKTKRGIDEVSKLLSSGKFEKVAMIQYIKEGKVPFEKDIVLDIITNDLKKTITNKEFSDLIEFSRKYKEKGIIFYDGESSFMNSFTKLIPKFIKNKNKIICIGYFSPKELNNGESKDFYKFITTSEEAKR